MHRCHYCGKILYEIPFKCHRCGRIFCRDHHLPENHHCSRNHNDHHKIHRNHCENCGRKLSGLPYICRRCGKILCDECRLPEYHRCTTPYSSPIQNSEPTPKKPGYTPGSGSICDTCTRTGCDLKSDDLTHCGGYVNPAYRPSISHTKTPITSKIPSLLKRIKKIATLKNFTIISLIFLIVGFLSYYYPVWSLDGLLRPLFSIGVWGFVIAYSLYAFKAWSSSHKTCATLMVTVPVLVYSFATAKITESSSLNLEIYILVLFCLIAIISAILLFLSEKIKFGIEHYAFRRRDRSYHYFSPNGVYVGLGVLIISALIITCGGVSIFTSNINTVLGSTTNYEINPQYISQSTITGNVSCSTARSTASTSVTLPVPIVTKNYETGPITKSFTYVLQGKSNSINVQLFSGIDDEIVSNGEPAACVRYNGDTTPCTSGEENQYYLKYLNDPAQKKYLDSLVNSIQKTSSNKDDQARIAINLVQQIPYDYGKLYSITSGKGQMRYPYQVLYDNKGVCAEKSLLLAYLLRGLGYGVVLFKFDKENHMAVGIKSPQQYSYLNSGYAFIESTDPTIPTDSQGDYVGVGKLTSTPEILQISDGDTMTTISSEYKDALTFNQIETISQSSGGMLDQNYYYVWVSLVQKYGIKTETNQ